ncbi:FkbM family methyltransferase [Streptomyces sp. NPDC059209]|uniref:FkbM family methyltransferase n=1 Tax=Streptomyces sp. NPDC059209 TaxID=3346769 RepID=UPI003677CE1D
MNISLIDVKGVNPHETELLYDEIFTRRVYQPPGLLLPEAPVVFDVGANIGMYSLFVLSERPRARVFAFEPIPPVFDLLRDNTRRHSAQTRVFPYGLAESEQETAFTHYPGYSTMSTRSAFADTAGEKAFVRQRVVSAGQPPEALQMLDELLDHRFREHPVRCTLRPLSAVLDEHPVDRIDVLKIDVQRGETQVLHGIEDRHWPLVRQIVMEVHDDPAGPTAGRLADVSAALRRRGFHVASGQEEDLAGSDRHSLFAHRDSTHSTGRDGAGRRGPVEDDPA